MKRKIVSLILCSGLLVGGAYYYFAHQRSNIALNYDAPIYPYQEERDLPFIMEMFDTQWFWLVAQSREEYDPTFHFKHLTWSTNPYNFGKLQVRIYRVGNEPTGFIAYYKKNFYEGYIWYLAIKPIYRNKGYAKALMRHAIADLTAQGCQTIRLLTRRINTAAIKVYTALGFTESSHDDTFIYFVLRPQSSNSTR